MIQLFVALFTVTLLGQASPPPKPFVMQQACIVSDSQAQQLLQVFADQYSAQFSRLDKLPVWKGRGVTGTFKGFFYLLGPAGQGHFYFQPADQPNDVISWEQTDNQPSLPRVSLGDPIRLELRDPPKRPLRHESVADPLKGEGEIWLRHKPGGSLHRFLVTGLN